MSRLRLWLIGKIIRQRILRILRSRFFLGICLLGLIFLAYFRVQFQRVQSEPITSWSTTVEADCAIVLTGGGGRIREGFDLLSQRLIKKLVISGVHPTSSLTEIFPLWLFYPELREEDVILERRSETTYGNAQQSLPLIEALKCREVLLITSHLHMYRAYRTFRHIFPEYITLIKVGIQTKRRYTLELGESLIEALKSLFYSTWAYGPPTDETEKLN
jgi:uncharacterized SAM-binding protein YcdF (DUF218 family)